MLGCLNNISISPSQKKFFFQNWISMNLKSINKHILKIGKNKFLAVRGVRPNLGSFQAEIYKGFPKCMNEKYFRLNFQIWTLNSSFRQNQLQRLESWGLDTSLYTYFDGLVQLCCLWPLWRYCHSCHSRHSWLMPSIFVSKESV